MFLPKKELTDDQIVELRDIAEGLLNEEETQKALVELNVWPYGTSTLVLQSLIKEIERQGREKDFPNICNYRTAVVQYFGAPDGAWQFGYGYLGEVVYGR